MADNLARSREIPAYDTYPAPAAEEELRMRSSHDLDQFATGEKSELEGTAERIGSAVGRAVELVRELPERLEEMRDRFRVIPGGSSGRPVGEQAKEFADRARRRLQDTRARASRYAHENPLETILAVGAAAFVLGAVLRIWRSRRG